MTVLFSITRVSSCYSENYCTVVQLLGLLLCLLRWCGT